MTWPVSNVHRSEFRPLGHHLYATGPEQGIKTACRRCGNTWPNEDEKASTPTKPCPKGPQA